MYYEVAPQMLYSDTYRSLGVLQQETLIVEETDLFDDLDEILCEYSNTEGVGPMGNFKEVEDGERFDDDEHILEDVPVSMNNFNFSLDTKHDLSIAVVEVHEHDLDVIDYDSFCSDLDDAIDPERIHNLKN
ncbi:hypothetical protein Tco_0731442 [Tanacetum coccineum]